MTLTRRNLLVSMAATAAAQAQRSPHATWKPKLGILGKYTTGNVAFAKQEGFTSIGLWANPKTKLDPDGVTDEQIERAKATVRDSGLYLSVIGALNNHIAPDPAARSSVNASFGKVIEIAGKMGAPFVGTSSGTLPGRPLDEQVAEIVRVYTEKYFPLCEKHRVRILWEPWPGGPNIATGPVGYEALFKAFGNSPYVGLQYDPSHLLWQMMDPIQTARDFIDKIYDVHLKDTEIRWDVLRRCGINPVNGAKWWNYRLPGLGSIQWSEFFSVLQRAGYTGAMSIEHEDNLYGAEHPGPEFTDDFKTGFRMAHRYLRQYVPD